MTPLEETCLELLVLPLQCHCSVLIANGLVRGLWKSKLVMARVWCCIVFLDPLCLKIMWKGNHWKRFSSQRNFSWLVNVSRCQLLIWTIFHSLSLAVHAAAWKRQRFIPLRFRTLSSAIHFLVVAKARLCCSGLRTALSLPEKAVNTKTHT